MNAMNAMKLNWIELEFEFEFELNEWMNKRKNE
jgi:hypothetical protein